jgi:hypothetical protein
MLATDTWTEPTTEDIEGFFLVEKRLYSPGTVRLRFRSLRAFYNWAQRRGCVRREHDGRHVRAEGERGMAGGPTAMLSVYGRTRSRRASGHAGRPAVGDKL